MGVMYDYFAAPSDEVVASMIDDPRCAADLAVEADGEVLVLTVTDGLRDGLADTGELTDVAAAWAGIEELRRFDAADLAVVLRELKELAVDAVQGGERLYCWVCV